MSNVASASSHIQLCEDFFVLWLMLWYFANAISLSVHIRMSDLHLHLNQKSSSCRRKSMLFVTCDLPWLCQCQRERVCVCVVCKCMYLFDHYVVSISSFHIHAGHALSMEYVAALQHEIRGSRRYTAALDVRWCVISFFWSFWESKLAIFASGGLLNISWLCNVSFDTEMLWIKHGRLHNQMLLMQASLGFAFLIKEWMAADFCRI